MDALTEKLRKMSPEERRRYTARVADLIPEELTPEEILRALRILNPARFGSLTDCEMVEFLETNESERRVNKTDP